MTGDCPSWSIIRVAFLRVQERGPQTEELEYGKAVRQKLDEDLSALQEGLCQAYWKHTDTKAPPFPTNKRLHCKLGFYWPKCSRY